MKLFEMPYIDVIKFAVKDVITTSVLEDEDDPAPELPTLDEGCVG